MICMLSETGFLQCCYLGTDPVSTSIPSIAPGAAINVQEAQEQLTKLNKSIKEAMNDPSNIQCFDISRNDLHCSRENRLECTKSSSYIFSDVAQLFIVINLFKYFQRRINHVQTVELIIFYIICLLDKLKLNS